MLVLVCGLPKSASTYAAEMACMLAETAGHQQLRLRSRVAEAGGSDKRFVATLDRSTIDRILGAIRREDLLVLKTHAPYTAFLAPYLEEGAIVPVVTFRDSWDAALSVYEAGVRAGERGDFSQNFHRFDTIPAAIDATARNWERTQTWLDCGYGIDLEFESLVRRPRAAAVRIVVA